MIIFFHHYLASWYDGGHLMAQKVNYTYFIVTECITSSVESFIQATGASTRLQDGNSDDRIKPFCLFSATKRSKRRLIA